jgi:tetratricopeptide (TPR) repeat protein
VIVSGFALRAKLLWELQRKDEAFALYAETFHRFRDEEDLEARRDLARMLLREATLAREDEQFEHEVHALDSLIEAFAEDDDDSRIRKTVSRALFRRALVLRKLDRPEEAAVVWGSLWERSKDDPDPPFETFAVTVLYNEAVSLGLLDRHQEACSVLDELIDRFVDDSSAEVAELVADATDLRAAYIAKSDDPASNVRECDRLLARIGGGGPPSVQLAAAMVVRLKIWELLAGLRTDEAIDAARQLTRSFVEEEDPTLAQQRGKVLVDAARVLCFHPRLQRASRKPGTRIALSLGDHLGAAARTKVSNARPGFLGRAVATVEVCRACQDQAIAMFEVVVSRSTESDVPEFGELAARARESWASAAGLRLHLVQMTKLTRDLVAQGEVAARLFQSRAEEPALSTWRAALLSSSALLTDEPADRAERIEQLRAYVARYRDGKSVPVWILVFGARVSLAYELTQARLRK